MVHGHRLWVMRERHRTFMWNFFLSIFWLHDFFLTVTKTWPHPTASALISIPVQHKPVCRAKPPSKTKEIRFSRQTSLPALCTVCFIQSPPPTKCPALRWISDGVIFGKSIVFICLWRSKSPIKKFFLICLWRSNSPHPHFLSQIYTQEEGLVPNARYTEISKHLPT